MVVVEIVVVTLLIKIWIKRTPKLVYLWNNNISLSVKVDVVEPEGSFGCNGLTNVDSKFNYFKARSRKIWVINVELNVK